MNSFLYTSNPSRVVFGSGSIKKLPEEISRLNLSRPLLLSGPRQIAQIEELKRILQSNIAGLFTEATMHTSISITEKAVEYANLTQADSVVSIGGGSAIGLGKAISIRTSLPHICIPTTYSGSESTSHLGETANGLKTTRSDARILPATVIYDVNLTLTLPSKLSATSGVNAIAHAVEALYATNNNPIINLLALEGIRALATSLPEIVQDPSSQSARSMALYEAWLCGTCLGSTSMSLHHKLCHTLGGSFNMPHSQTHTVVLPHALAYNMPSVPDVMKQLAGVLPASDGDALKGLNTLLSKLNVERSLDAFGMKESDVDRAADIAVSNAYANPREVEKAKIREVIRRAWAGEEARADL